MHIDSLSQSLIPHMKRVNYRAAQWKLSLTTNLKMPEADDHGWIKVGKYLEPLWSEGDILPPALADILESSVASDSDESLQNEETDWSFDEDSDSDSDFLYCN